MTSDRYRVACGKVPSESGCTVVIEGPEDDVLDAAAEHARSKHGHTEDPATMREMIRPAPDRMAGRRPDEASASRMARCRRSSAGRALHS